MSQVTFSQLGLPSEILRACEAMGISHPTPIQAKAIPPCLQGSDLIACAPTGTGKTAAFGIPMIVRLLAQPGATALVLVPTRELADQVFESIRKMALFVPQASTAVLIGGVSMVPQKKALARSPRILIATPGRLIDHLDSRPGLLSKVSYLVLDEADRMLDMGFAPQLNRIASFLPPSRQTLLFSATVPTDILKLAGRFMTGDPQRVSVAPLSAEERPKINEKTIEVGADGKNQALLDALAEREGSVIVFARTQVRTERAAKFLTKSGVPAESIHGGLSQGQRRRALEAFREGRVRVLVATDIAARGIDVPHVAHVINFDLPSQPEDYVHRIGRTGRAGREGEALTLLTAEDRAGWKAIERLRGGGGNSHTSSPRFGGGQSSGRQAGPRSGGGGSRRGAPSGGGARGGERGARAGGGPRGFKAPGSSSAEGARPARFGAGARPASGARPARSGESRGPSAERSGERPERSSKPRSESRSPRSESARPASARSPGGARPGGSSAGKPSWSERLFGRKK